MITLFTTTKPFHGLAATHQLNALSSWTRLRPPPTVVVFGAEDGTGKVCQQLDLKHVSTVEMDEHGLPMLDFMFMVAQEFSNTEFVCYANADIIILEGLTEATRLVDDKFPGGFLGVCRRWDIDMDEPLEFWNDRDWDRVARIEEPDILPPGSYRPLDFLKSDWHGVVRERIQHGKLYTPCSSDLFLFRKPLRWSLPPFTAGRPKWDNWMLWAACENNMPVVDLTEAVIVAHPNHGYGANGQIGQKAWRGHVSGERNEKLAGGKVFCMKHVRKAGNLWRLVDGEVIKS